MHNDDGVQRQVLLCDPEATPATPLLDALLLRPAPGTVGFRQASGLVQLRLAQLM